MRSFERKDLKEINGWMKARGMPLIDIEDLPGIGMISDDVASGFLVTTDCSICFLEAFITNPEVEKAVRFKSIREIGNHLLDIARGQGYKRCIILSEILSARKEAIENGFNEVRHTMLVKDL